MVYGVGVIGAGAGVAALHLPTLGLLDDIFGVVHITDSGSGRAEALASPLGARWSTGEEHLVADPDVDVVLICSPPGEHARQILAAVAAGKRAVFCEKPLALTADEVDRVIEAARTSGTVLMVGTNHLFDFAWGRAKHHLLAARSPVRTVSVALSLPPNTRYHEAVAELDGAPAAPRPRPDMSDPDVVAGMVWQLVSGLAVHDLPALRDLAPVFEHVVFARAAAPVGYLLAYRASGVLIQLAAVMHPEGADALWRMTIATEHDRIEVAFPPAFVHAGSATVSVRGIDGRRTTYSRASDDGYLSEWRAFAGLLSGSEPVEYDELRADALYGIAVADAAAERVKHEATR
ncbi:gfo/Idh/MocA family oxidoreductase [Subtercola sp. Z020]|uniref:Gfo/Idh/MocA family protein n=1 Tax=Subtercola sp. Z020 TaxID=2080582 RepID=UPI000CE92D27|nr:Gfo/Idh/MocA family oxidoreductase [Subtercola sp. Z020]PPF89604.1 gfo/Idh/MocA family oxidoreductase [Subtercola sp. Z020]